MSSDGWNVGGEPVAECYECGQPIDGAGEGTNCREYTHSDETSSCRACGSTVHY